MSAPELAAPPTRIVWAVDVMATVVSLARIAEPEAGGIAPRPAIGLVTMPPSGVSHTPRTQWSRAEKVADEVFAKLTNEGTIKPTLVVLAKQQWGPHSARRDGGKSSTKGVRGAGISVPADPTAQRRMALQYAIEAKLHTAGIPVAEFPYPTALAWMLQGAQRGTGKSPMSALADSVRDEWAIVPPKVQRAEARDAAGNLVRASMEVTTPFRPQVAVLAAVGAMACGVETSVTVTEPRLEQVHGAGNLAVQFPPNRRCPLTLEAWGKLHAAPVLLTVGD